MPELEWHLQELCVLLVATFIVERIRKSSFSELASPSVANGYILSSCPICSRRM